MATNWFPKWEEELTLVPVESGAIVPALHWVKLLPHIGSVGLGQPWTASLRLLKSKYTVMDYPTSCFYIFNQLNITQESDPWLQM